MWGILAKAKTFTSCEASLEAIILAVPAPTGVTTPLLSTEATAGLSDVQKVVVAIGFPFWSNAFAVNC